MGEDTLVWDNEVGAQNPQERVAHAQSCGDEENTLGGRRTWDRQVGEGLRQWSNLGWRAEKAQKNDC